MRRYDPDNLPDDADEFASRRPPLPSHLPPPDPAPDCGCHETEKPKTRRRRLAFHRPDRRDGPRPDFRLGVLTARSSEGAESVLFCRTPTTAAHAHRLRGGPLRPARHRERRAVPRPDGGGGRDHPQAAPVLVPLIHNKAGQILARSHGTRGRSGGGTRWLSDTRPGQGRGRGAGGRGVLLQDEMNGLAGVHLRKSTNTIPGTPRKFAYRTPDQRVPGAYFAHARPSTSEADGMSLDIDLYVTVDGSSIHVFEANITHNLTKMAANAGVYYACWHPEEINATHAKAHSSNA